MLLRESPVTGADKDREVYWSGSPQAIAARVEVFVLLGKRARATAHEMLLRNQTLKLSPQPHSPLALGFLNLKASFNPCFTKSTTVPSMSRRLSGSTTTLTPRSSNTASPGPISSA